MSSEDGIIVRHRGDTKPIIFQLWLDQANLVPLPITGYTFTFSVNPSEKPLDETELIFKRVPTIVGDPDNGRIICLLDETEMDLTPRTYYYDLEIVDAGGYIDTPMLNKFKIRQDITKVR